MHLIAAAGAEAFPLEEEKEAGKSPEEAEELALGQNDVSRIQH